MIVTDAARPGATDREERMTTTTTPKLDAQEKALCRAINTFRAEHGKAPLKVSVALTRSAEWMSHDMASHDTFDHVDSHGRDFDVRLEAFGYHQPTKAENIAAGESSAAATLAQWKASAPHRAILLKSRLKVMGVGRARNVNSMFDWYWTADFGGTVTATMAI
ncbi:MAG: hypothetical protein QOG42_640 [Solirubrobacteraceae bacterium]|jgi:uncharacterized protein YkwD|nr:hypothetical protein [Solirubrobacteraceae bacterium]